MRLTPGGAVDGGFGSGGVRLKDVGSPASGGPIGQDAAGRIVHGRRDPRLGRLGADPLHPDGAVDGGFGSGGVSRFGVGPSAVPGDLFVDGEKVVVGGFVYDSAFHPRTAVARVLAGASTTGGTGGTPRPHRPGPGVHAGRAAGQPVGHHGRRHPVHRDALDQAAHEVPNVATGKLHFSRAHATLVDTVPYADVDFSFTHKNCAGKRGSWSGRRPTEARSTPTRRTR
jgi:hypothetical protein